MGKMGRIFKYLVYLFILAGIGLVGFAYLGNLDPDQQPESISVEIDVD